MDRNEPESPELAHDPEIAALLDFEPVVHRMPRADGWTAERQRGFIAGLAETGCQETAAHRVGMTARGAYSLRKQIGATGFKTAWEKAIALHKKRLAFRETVARMPAATQPHPARNGLEDGELEQLQIVANVLDRYRKKLQQERECRLAGRIVEADYYVRQLTFIEIALDLGCHIDKLQDLFRSGEIDIFQTIGTPMAVLMDRIRRD